VHPEIEAFIADELASGRTIAPAHLAELRALRMHHATVLSVYARAAATLAELRADERGRAMPKRKVPRSKG
jgi:hypothetical protein